MSYILQALKKAEEARGAAPRAVPTPRPLPPAGRARWPWIAGGLVALSGVAGLVALWTLGLPAPTAPPPAATTDTAPAVAAPVPSAPPAPAPAVAVSPAPPTTPPGAARAEAPSPPKPAPRPAPARPRAAPTLRAPAPAVAERAAADPPPAPASAAAGPPPAVERGAAPPVAARPRGASPAVAESRVAPRPPAAPATPAAPVAASGDLKARVARLSLQVLSWAPDPRDRFVFVNGRKYGEGQAIDDTLLVERITEDSVVLAYQGERVTLKGP
jgi:hypothetical protein